MLQTSSFIKQVVDNILLVLKEVWNNHTYSDHKFTKKLNEVELIVTTHIYRELMYLETTRTYLLCVTKKKDDYVKLWRQCNDGITWVYNSCSPARN
ncbi:unnamed protein product [Rhizophagus irregularis]|nr:unnamed protein product [Rhizophagus irregularis]